jgi:[calcium/calmodulin-dependent protein kinase] kinase
VKLADFGVSQVFDGTDEIARTDGTPAFLSPEAIAAGPFSGQAADIWAAGVTLYCMLYARLPFSASTCRRNY